MTMREIEKVLAATALLAAASLAAGCGGSPAVPAPAEIEAAIDGGAAPAPVAPPDAGPPPATPEVDAGADGGTEVSSLADLAQQPERSGTVLVSAEFYGVTDARECRPEQEDCTPCDAITTLRYRTPDGAERRVRVLGHPEEWRKIDRFRPYVFELELEPGYPRSMHEYTCSADRIDLRLVGCRDCPRTRETSLAELMRLPEEPGYASLQAYLISSRKPAPCPRRHKCQPAAAATVIAERPDDEAAVHLCAHGLIPRAKKLIRKGEPRTFVLQLESGYMGHIGPLDVVGCGDPRWYPIGLFECLDCE